MSALGSRWYWTHNGSHAGPVTWAELQSLAKSGKLNATDLVLREGSSTWQAANTAKNVEQQPATPAAPAPASPLMINLAQPSFSAVSVADSEDLGTSRGGIRVGRMFFGLLLCVGGIAMSMLSYNAAVAKGGGTYFFYTGPIILGLIFFVQSFSPAKHS